MMKYPRIIGWSIVITMWTGVAIGFEHYANKTNNNSDVVQETINTAEDMVFWIQEDLRSGDIDSSTAETYIDNLEEVITDLKTTR